MKSAAVAAEVFTGLDMIKQDPSRKPIPTAVNAAMTSTIATAIPHMDGSTSAAIREAAVAVYVARGGIVDETKALDPEKWNGALRSVLGGRASDSDTGWYTENGVATILPPGVTGKQFETFTDGLADVDLIRLNARNRPDQSYVGMPVYSSGRRASVADIASEGTFVQKGNGLYAIWMRDGLLQDPAGGMYLMKIDPAAVKSYVRPVVEPPPLAPPRPDQSETFTPPARNSYIGGGRPAFGFGAQ